LKVEFLRDPAPVHRRLGRTLEVLGRDTEARRHFRLAVSAAADLKKAAHAAASPVISHWNDKEIRHSSPREQAPMQWARPREFRSGYERNL
jgi:hypothetical protein